MLENVRNKNLGKPWIKKVGKCRIMLDKKYTKIYDSKGKKR